MRVLVTGGAGKVGRYVVRELVRRSHEVTVIGRTAGRTLAGAAYRAVDTTDYPSLRDAVAGHEAVVHLAALPHNQAGTSTEVFATNGLGTYQVFQACADNGIRRVVAASSINALGHGMGVRPLPVRYFPIDEDHPTLASDPYSFSKREAERIAEFFWLKDGLSSVSIRIPYVADPLEQTAERLRAAKRDGRTRYLRRDYWTMIDNRDSGRAFAAGVEADFDGAHAVFANDSHNCLGLPSRQLAAEHYPDVTEWREPVAGDESLVSIRRIQALLGWQPKFSWRGVADGGPLP